MTGLLAAISSGGAPTPPEAELDALLAAYRDVRGVDQEPLERRSQGRVAALVAGRPGQRGVVSLGSAPGAGPAASWSLGSGSAHAVDGRPRPAGTGLPHLADVDGQFALVGYDAAADEALVANDPMGMCALYVAERDGTTYVSTSSLALARLLRADADRLALQTFLLTGYHFGTGSNWTGVHRLEPATALRIGRSGRRSETYWRPAVDRDLERLPFADTVDAAISAGVEVLAHRFAGAEGLSVDLTGGFDSRLMALLLHKAGVGFTANTRESPDRVDLDLAGRMAGLKGWPWEALHLPGDWDAVLPGRLHHSLAWGDATLEVLQLSRVLHAHERLGQRRPELLSAGGGEHFQWYAWETEFVGGLSTKVNYDNWIDMRLIRPVDTSVLAGSPRPQVREDLRRRMSSWAEPYRGERNTTQLDVLYAYKSTGHFGAYRSADDGLLHAQLPFYFRRVFETAFSTRYRYRNSHRLMRHMIERLDPQVAALPTTRGGPAQPWRPSTVHRFLPYYGKLARKAVTKVSGKVLDTPLLQDTTSFAWAPRANAVVLEHLDRTGVLPRDGELRGASLYDVDRLRGLLARADRPDFHQHALLGRVVTVELALAAADVGIA